MNEQQFNNLAAPPELGQRISVTQEAYVAIRSMLIAGDIPPGSRVTVRPLVEKLQLSATPVKAALITLEREGVLESKLHRGFFVPELSLDDLQEIFEMREALDRLACERVAKADNHVEIAAQLRSDCEKQRGYLEAGDVDAYRSMDLTFHHNLWTQSGNRRLQRTGEQLLDQMRLGNALSARQPGRVELSLREHVLIVDAIDAGDAERAASMAAQHIQSVRATLVESAGSGAI